MSEYREHLPELPAEHPRVYLRAQRYAAIRENMSAEQNLAAYRYYLDCLEEKLDGTLPPPAENMARRTNSDPHKLGVMECYALSHVLDGDRDRGIRAKEAIKDYHRTIVHYDYNTEGQELFTIGLIYDWCYDCLTEEDKTELYQAAIETASRMEMGYPNFKQGCVTGHGVEGQLMRDLMCVAVAMADEHPELYEYAAEIFFGRMVDPKKLFYDSGMYPQGSHYLPYRMQWEFLATEIWDVLGVPLVFGDRQADPMYWFLYMRRPDGTVLYDGDESLNNLPMGQYYCGAFRSFFHAASLFCDPYLKAEFFRERPFLEGFREVGNQSLNAVEYLLFNDPTLRGRPLSELPLSRYFGGIKGEMIARTGWADGSDAPVAVVEMKVNCLHTANHQHLDGGAFQIYYKGYLATDTGYYQAFRNSERTPESGNTNYGSSHFCNYYRRTIAHNSMLVYDPNEDFGEYAGYQMSNDGGQRFPNGYRESRSLEMLTDPENNYRVGEVLAHGMGDDPIAPEYTYLKGDLAPAYSDKVEAFERSFLFLNLKDETHPALLFVHDRVVASDPSFRKAFLLHTLDAPYETENGYAAIDSRKGYGGKLTMDILLPTRENRSVTLVGGEGRQHEVDGVHYLGRALEGNHRNEGDGWRLELSPAIPEREDTFLTVFQMTDGETEELPSALVDAGTHIGARVGNRLAFFAKRPMRAERMHFLSEESGVRVTVADLAGGCWEINGQQVRVDPDCGVAAFDAVKGENILVRSDSVEEPPSESAKSTDPKSKKAASSFGIVLKNEHLAVAAAERIGNSYRADPRAIIRAWGLSADQAGSTLILTDGKRTARLPLFVKNGIDTVSIAGLAAAFGHTARYDSFADLLYLS